MHPQAPYRPRTLKPLLRQRGVALLTTLLVLSLVVGIAAAVLLRQSYALRQTSDYQDLEEAWGYAQSLEQQTRAWLQNDDNQLPYSALNKEALAKFQAALGQQAKALNDPKLKLEDLQLDDLQARYNLNNLVDAQGKPVPGEDSIATALAQSAGLPPTFTSVIIDWIDPNIIPINADGAESDSYASSGYRTADTYLTDPSELRLLKLDLAPEKKEESLAAFQQNIATLPPPTTVNANTAKPDVLAALGLSASQMTAIKDAQNASKPFKTTAELGALGIVDPALKRLGVTSSYFRLTGTVKVGRAQVFLNSIFFHQPNKAVRVIMHQFTRTTTTDTTSHASNPPANPE